MDIISKALAQDKAIEAATQVGENVLRESGITSYILLITTILFFLISCLLGWLLMREKDRNSKEETDEALGYAEDLVAALGPLREQLVKVETSLAIFQGNLRTDLKDMFSGVDEIIKTVTDLIIKMTEAHGRHETQTARLVDRIDNMLNLRRQR